MKKIKKSTGVAIAFLIYVSVTAAYLLPRNTEVSQTEKILTVVGSYAIVLLLWLVLRKKEQMRERRKEGNLQKSNLKHFSAFGGRNLPELVGGGSNYQ